MEVRTGRPDHATVINQQTHSLTIRTVEPNIIKTSTPHNSTNMGDIKAALAAFELLKPREKVNYTQIATQYGVDRTTLLKRHRGV